MSEGFDIWPSDIEERTLPAGSMVHLAGLPVTLEREAIVTSHPGNWKEIDKVLNAAKEASK